jgi:hypothetical protein
VPYSAGDDFALKIGKELENFASWAISRDPRRAEYEKVHALHMGSSTHDFPGTRVNQATF